MGVTGVKGAEDEKRASSLLLPLSEAVPRERSGAPSLARLPVRWRLTLWYAALLAVSMALFGGLLYVVLRQELHAGFDEQLLNQAALTMTAVRVEDEAPVFQTASSDIVEGEYFLRLLDRDGRPVVDSGLPVGSVPLDSVVVAAALEGQTVYSSVLDEDGETLRIISVPVRGEGGDEAGPLAGVLQVGLDRNELDEPLAMLLSALALVGPVVLALAAAGGYLLAGRALAPVAAITDLAADIDAADLHARLHLNLPDDELGRLARTFDAMLARIDEAFERQRRFTGDAAHELRTPLSLMRSQVDLALARPRSTVAYREALEGLDGDLERMTGLVAALLTLARADAGRLEPDRTPLDLAATIAAVLEQYAPLAETAGVELRDDSAPAPLVADADLLVQLLVNLIDNALAHTPPQGSVTVGCRAEGDLVRLWVTDTGEGLAPHDAARIFDRFYRVDRGRSRARGGAGLGLAICKSIVEAHGGAIGITSRLGDGTRIDVTLPATAEGRSRPSPSSYQLSAD
jgi:heavy metal sensor kinase